MPRRTRTRLISQKKVRGASTESKPHGDMTFPSRVATSTWAEVAVS